MPPTAEPLATGRRSSKRYSTSTIGMSTVGNGGGRPNRQAVTGTRRLLEAREAAPRITTTRPSVGRRVRSSSRASPPNKQTEADDDSTITIIRAKTGASTAPGSKRLIIDASQSSSDESIGLHRHGTSVSSVTSTVSATSISNDPFFRAYQSCDPPASEDDGAEISKQEQEDRLTSAIIEYRQCRQSLVPTSAAADSPPNFTARESSSRTESDRQLRGEMPMAMFNINIVVIGASRVGKSTFIQRALGLRQLSNTGHSASRLMSLEGVVQNVQMLEVDLDDLTFSPGDRVSWPLLVEGLDLPRIDGALLLYDVSNQSSISSMPEVLGALNEAKIPSVLVSCKCDTFSQSRELEAERSERARKLFGGVECLPNAVDAPEKQLKCMAAILGRIMENRNDLVSADCDRRQLTRSRPASSGGATPTISSRHWANSSGLQPRGDPSDDSPPPVSRSKRMPQDNERQQQRSHGRASSEISGTHYRGAPSSGTGTSRAHASSTESSQPRSTPAATDVPQLDTMKGGKASRNSTGSHAAPSSSSSHQKSAGHSQAPTPRQSYSRSSTAPTLSTQSERVLQTTSTRRRSSTSRDDDRTGVPNTTTGRSHAFEPTLSTLTAGRPSSKAPPGSSLSAAGRLGDSFLIMEDEHDASVQRSSDDIPLLDREDREADDIPIRPERNAGSSFDELVKRLLAQPLSKADSNFAAIFLCLYRKFATPGELLTAVLIEFEDLDREDSPHMIRISTQLRHLGVLTQWVTGYPGDFAHPTVRGRLERFLKTLVRHRAFATSAKEMRLQLECGIDDQDAGWARSDPAPDKLGELEAHFSTLHMHRTSSTLLLDPATEESVREAETVESRESDGPGIRPARTSEAPSSSSSGGHSGKWSAGSFQTLLNSVESAEREAQKLTPHPRIPMTKVQWHEFMAMSAEDVAKEMTRIDSIMFSSIRPRDLVRHVSMKSKQKASCKNLENVNRMIVHFNHVAYWVSGMIILRDKPKHRALAMERFMHIARALRRLNNYNSLGAVIAGINASAIYRLAQTRELIPYEIGRKFQGLEILMGTQKSHFAYRLAWENTSSGRIPFIPLHRRDLVSAEEGNRTFLDERSQRINWKKFEIMGEVIVGIQKSQGTPYVKDLERRAEVQLLILDGLFMKDDEDLYNRSVQLEGPNAIPADSTRKKFPWFQR